MQVDSAGTILDFQSLMYAFFFLLNSKIFLIKSQSSTDLQSHPYLVSMLDFKLQLWVPGQS